MSGRIAEAVAARVFPGRLWLYSNYHCNLTCTYCLTASAPGVARRQLGLERMVGLAGEAKALGFDSIGVTGGEPFLLGWMPEALLRLSELLPVVALSNGTLFGGERLTRLRPLAGRPVKIQISLDGAAPERHDPDRGKGGYAAVVGAIRRLTGLGIGVRVGTTAVEMSASERERLCALHRDLGVAEDDHVVRPIIRRGRAADRSMGIEAGLADLSPELTITADGAFWSPFGPTITGGRLDTDLLITQATTPLADAAAALLALVEGRPPALQAATQFR